MTIKEVLESSNRHERTPYKNDWGKRHDHLFVALDADGVKQLYCIEGLQYDKSYVDAARARDPLFTEREVFSEFASPEEVEVLGTK